MTLRLDSSSANGMRFSGNEFPPFKPPHNSTYVDDETGKRHRYDAYSSAWTEITSIDDVVCVLDYMTVPQIADVRGGAGLVDVTVAVQEASTAAGTGTLIFPKGTYKLTGGITTTGNIRGSGPGTILAVGADITPITINADRSQVTDIAFRADTTTTKPAVEVIGYKAFWHIRDVSIFNNGASKFNVGVKVTSGLSGTLDNVRVSDAVTYGVYLTGSGGNNPNAIDARGVRVRNSGTADIFIENTSGGLLSGAIAEGTGPLGIYVKGGAQYVVVGSYTEKNDAAAVGIRFDDQDDSAILGGYGLASGTGKNIDLLGCRGTLITNHTPNGPTTSIVIDAASSRTTIIGGDLAPSQISDASTTTNILVSNYGLRVNGVTAIDTTGLLNTKASVAGGSGFRIPHGTAPSAPVDGDMWTTSAGLFVRVNGATVGPLS